jgi:hypothetical protein
MSTGFLIRVPGVRIAAGAPIPQKTDNIDSCPVFIFIGIENCLQNPQNSRTKFYLIASFFHLPSIILSF